MKKLSTCLVLASALTVSASQVSHAEPRAGLALLAPTASTETRAWSAAKSALPSGLSLLVGLNGAQLRSTQLFQKVLPLLQSRSDVKDGLDLIKSQCNIDVTQAVDSMVVGLQGRNKGVFVLALNGLDQAAVTSCLSKVAAADKHPQKLIAKQQGNIVEYNASGEKDKLYMAWLAKDVVAMATEPFDKAVLKKFTGGGLKGDVLGKTAGTLKTDSAVWFVTTKNDQIPELAQAKISKAYGTANFQSGNVDVNAHVAVDSAAHAAAAATGLNAQLDNQRQHNPMAGNLLKNVKVTTSGPELIATGSFAESDLLTLASVLM